MFRCRISLPHSTCPLPLPPFAHIISKAPVICHHHLDPSYRVILDGSDTIRQDDGFRNERVSTWSALLLLVAIGPHAFNSEKAYPLDPRQRVHSWKGGCPPVYQSPFHPRPSPCFSALKIHPAVTKLTRLRRIGRRIRTDSTRLTKSLCW